MKTSSANNEDGADKQQNTGLVETPALKAHIDKLMTRAKLERSPREAKWLENRLTAEGEVYSAGDAGKITSSGQFRVGDDNQVERLRVARQKVVAAKVSIGDALYKNNRVPFLLGWAAGVKGDPDLLEQVRVRVDEIAYTGNVPDKMRTEIEDSASFGEGWVHGTVAPDPQGRFVAGVETVCCWEMYFDSAGEDDLSQAEYVIRERLMSPFEIARLVNLETSIYDNEKVKIAISTASRSKSKASNKPGEEDRRLGASLVVWREFWCSVPRRVLESQDIQPGDGSTDESTLDWVRVVVITADDGIVAVKHNPGPLPYFRVVWDVDRMRSLPQGVYDIMGPTQQVMTGVIRAWLTNVRMSSQITLAGKRDRIMQDAEMIGAGIRFIDLDPDTRNVREAIEQFTVEGQTAGLVQAIEMLMEFADLESHIPRLQSGQQPISDATAFEIRSRLAASGKYLNEIVRRHDACIRWVIGWILYIMALEEEIDDEARMSVVPKGFAQFADLVQRLDGLLRLIALGGQSPRVDGLLNHKTLVRQIAEADDLEVGKVLLTDEEIAQRSESEAASEERQLALASAKADLAGKQAKANRDEAEAESKRGRSQLDRSKFIKDVEDTQRKPKGEQPNEQAK